MVRLTNEEAIEQQTEEDGDLFMWFKHQAFQGVVNAQVRVRYCFQGVLNAQVRVRYFFQCVVNAQVRVRYCVLYAVFLRKLMGSVVSRCDGY